MRKQNPPQANLENAEYLERYLRPSVILPVYTVAGLASIAAITLAFTYLIHNRNLAATQTTFALFVTLICIPAVAVVAFCVLRPRDPISAWLIGGAKSWRRPLDLHREECSFRELLGNGEGLSVKLSLFYPVRNNTEEVRQNLFLYLQAALSKECSMSIEAPDRERIEQMIDSAVEIVAEEGGVPVLYSEVAEITTIHAEQNYLSGDFEPMEVLRTGT